jgi:tRNA(Ile2) C34 agmatinyltransferase TiaS
MGGGNLLYADACGNCGQYDVIPECGIAVAPDGLAAGYRCPSCRHAWVCSWQAVPGRVMPPEPAAGQSQFDRHLAAQVYELAAMNRAHRHFTYRDLP